MNDYPHMPPRYVFWLARVRNYGYKLPGLWLRITGRCPQCRRPDGHKLGCSRR